MRLLLCLRFDGFDCDGFLIPFLVGWCNIRFVVCGCLGLSGFVLLWF